MLNQSLKNKIKTIFVICTSYIAICLSSCADPSAGSGMPEFFTNVKTVSAGGAHTAAIDKDGKLWAWGRNIYGQLGDGGISGTSSNVPVQVGTSAQQALPNWKWIAVSAGNSHTAAIDKDDKLWAWGRNDYGQLGDGTKTNKSAPVLIGDRWIAVFAGRDYTAAIKRDGVLWSWGDNGSGQLGSGTTENRTVPRRVILSGW